MTLQLAHKLDELEKAQAQSPRTLTLLDLVAAVSDVSATEEEVVGTVTRLINSGKVNLVGNFRGADVRVG